MSMTPLAQRILELDVAATALAQTLGRTERADDVRRRVKELRLAAGRVVLAELAAHVAQVDPAEAVRLVVEHALHAGLDWQTIVAMVNTASERRAAP